MYSFWDWRGHLLTLAVIAGAGCVFLLLVSLPGWVWGYGAALLAGPALYMLVWGVVNERL